MTREWARSFLARAAVLSILWLLLTAADPGGLLAGGVVVAGGTAVSLLLAPPGIWRLRPIGALRFVPYFLWHSLAGGADVAARALHPRLPLHPRFETFRLRLPPGTARTFFTGVVSLLPGTLAAELQDDHLLVHVIGAGATEERLRALEVRVGDVFGEGPALRSRSGGVHA